MQLQVAFKRPNSVYLQLIHNTITLYVSYTSISGIRFNYDDFISIVIKYKQYGDRIYK